MNNASQPNPANSLTPCPFGGNPKVAAQMGFSSCGIARPGPFYNNLNLKNSMQGGGKILRGSRKSHQGGENDNGSSKSLHIQKQDETPVQAPVQAVIQPPPKSQCPQECIAKGCGKRNFLHNIFGMNGGSKSRKGGSKSRKGGRKSRKGGRKLHRGGRKSRRVRR